jgi:hypothetical protein
MVNSDAVAHPGNKKLVPKQVRETAKIEAQKNLDGVFFMIRPPPKKSNHGCPLRPDKPDPRRIDRAEAIHVKWMAPHYIPGGKSVRRFEHCELRVHAGVAGKDLGTTAVH